LSPSTVYLCQATWKPDEKKVFLGKKCKGFKENVYNQIINRCLRKARALAGITAEAASGSHTFRHTFIKGQERDNRELADIMKIVAAGPETACGTRRYSISQRTGDNPGSS
jgi:integrase